MSKLRNKVRLLAVVAVAPLFSQLAFSLNVTQVQALDSVTFEYVGRTNGGSGLGGSEISAYDAATKRVFVTNGNTNKIDIFDISYPTTPTLVKSVDLSALGATGIQSVASKNGLVAAAASMNSNNQAAGRVFIMNAQGVIDSRAPTGVVVGSLPDSVHFTPDGRFVLSANEGEPKDYCLVDGVLPTTTDPYGSVSIIDLTSSALATTTLDFSAWDSQAAAIRTAGGRVYGPGASVAQDLEPEYIAFTPDSKTAIVTLQENNSVAEINLETKTVKRILGLGYKDHSLAGNALDVSDREVSSSKGSINIANWPVKGMYQPDNVGMFTGADGNNYFVTGNEGDAREYKCLLGGLSTGSVQSEDERVGTVGVDGTILASTLSAAASLGRLSVTRFAPATYTNGGGPTTAVASTDFTSLYSLGARSMSVWKVPTGSSTVDSAVLVADTGDLIEKTIATKFPDNFNSDWNSATGAVNAMDTRSDNKGPEPEGIAVGNAFGKNIAFVGLERIGGVMMFDLTNPAQPAYLDYINTSNFKDVGGANFSTAGAPAGDVSPEGIFFINATDSPLGVPMILVSNELSGTTAIYKLNGTAKYPDAPSSVTATLNKGNVNVSWKAPVLDGGAAVYGYQAVASPSGKSCTVQTATSCSISNLAKGIDYTFKVYALNAAGKSLPSASSKSVTISHFKNFIGSKVAVSKVPKEAAKIIEVRVQGLKVGIGITPTIRVKKYVVTLYSGKELKVKKLVNNTGLALGTVLSAPAKGSYRVVVAAVLRNGGKSIWNGPLVSVKK